MKRQVIEVLGTAAMLLLLVVPRASAQDRAGPYVPWPCGDCRDGAPFGYWAHYFETVFPKPHLDWEGPIHTEWYPGKCWETHITCIEKNEVDFAVAIETLFSNRHDAIALRRMAQHRRDVLFNEARGLVQLIGCSGNVEAQVPIPVSGESGITTNGS